MATHNQAEQVVKNGNGLGNNPSDDPQHQGDSNPGSNRQETPIVHSVSATEEPHIDVFRCDVAINNTRNHDLPTRISFTRDDG